jgi:hypothetical protein
VHNITLICSIHREHGNCNSNELFKIIKKINPDIIFEEIHPDKFNSYYIEKTAISLETNAIMKYLHCHQIDHLPVDNYEASGILQFYKEVDYMNNRIFENSPEYSELFKERHLKLGQYGFDYLNSDICTSLLKKLAILEEEIIKKLGDDFLIHIYNSWIDFNRKRENEMIKNIYDYSRGHTYNNGIFIIGTEHKIPIKKSIQKYEAKDALKINWKYL